MHAQSGSTMRRRPCCCAYRCLVVAVQGYGPAGAYSQPLVAAGGMPQLVNGYHMPAQVQVQQVYNPAAVTDISKANAVFIQQQQPQLLGAYLQRPQ
jgi:hypothetical protein